MAGAEILPTEMFHKDLPKGSPVETLRRDLLQSLCREVSDTELAKTSLIERLNRDLI